MNIVYIDCLWLSYNPPENNPEIADNDQRCATTTQNTLNPGFHHIKRDETYMPELFLTLPEHQNKRNDQLLMISLWVFDDFANTPQNSKS